MNNSKKLLMARSPIWVIIFVYILLIFVSTPFNQSYVDEDGFMLVDRYESDLVQTMNSSRLQTGGRYVGAIVGYTIDVTVKIFADLFRGPDENYFNVKSTDLVRSNYFIDTTQQDILLAYLSNCLYRFLILLPFLVIIFISINSLYSAIVFLFLIFFTLSGYGLFQEFLARDLFHWLKHNQWHPFWEFQQMQKPMYFDLLTVGFLGFLALIMIVGKADHLPLAVLITAIGQFSYLHLGFVAGVSLALFTLFTSAGELRSRVQKASLVLLTCGITAIFFAFIHGSIAYVLNEGNIEFASGGGSGFGWSDLTDHAAPNRENYKHVLFRLSYYHLVPLFLGAVAGFIVAGFEKTFGKKQASGLLPISLFCVLAAFLMATAVGFFFATNYSAERGREFLPAACLAILLGFTTIRWVYNHSILSK